jgi:hypothetical protein
MAMRVYRVTQKTGFFEETNVLVLTLTSVMMSVHVHMVGQVKYEPGDYGTIEGKHLDIKMRYPIVGPLAAAAAGKLPDEIHIGIVDGKAKEADLPHGTWGIKTFMDYVFQPFIVNYYERHLGEIRSKAGTAKAWPPAWQMARVVRNAISHGGKVHFASMSHPPVMWRGLSLGPAHQGQQLLGEIINGADLFQLVTDMEEERSPGTLLVIM